MYHRHGSSIINRLCPCISVAGNCMSQTSQIRREKHIAYGTNRCARDSGCRSSVYCSDRRNLLLVQTGRWPVQKTNSSAPPTTTTTTPCPQLPIFRRISVDERSYMGRRLDEDRSSNLVATMNELIDAFHTCRSSRMWSTRTLRGLEQSDRSIDHRKLSTKANQKNTFSFLAQR